ncbi:sigma factor-like helix-turn-helix DNA-binding protein [Sorangium sp. So ce362]|uniref:sigma factor-like helix-turn-helix DNA-binding protein n=1 Tax=Sorangium sp. So ce362 TaxID=3133303 RepID=UPI003F62770E
MSGPRQLPLTRGECVDGPRPCPHVRCVHHLGPELVAPEFATSCALDVADRGGASAAEVAAVLGVSVEEARRIEGEALARLRAWMTGYGGSRRREVDCASSQQR